MLKRIPLLMDIRNLQLAFSAPLSTRKESKKKIRTYRNRYSGRRCFIVGNGPSLKALDLNLIKDEVSFAANTIYKIFPQTAWRPTFYCIQDEKVLQEIMSDNSLVLVRLHSYECILANLFVGIWRKKEMLYMYLFGVK